MLNYPELAKLLEFELKRKNWKQTKLAQEAGLELSTVNGWLKGRYFPRPRQIDALAEALYDLADRDTFRARVRESKMAHPIENAETASKKQFRIGTFHFPPFVTSAATNNSPAPSNVDVPDGFANRAMGRLLALSEHEPVWQKCAGPSDSLKRMASNSLDMSLAMLDTIDSRGRCFHSPVRATLNAVVLLDSDPGRQYPSQQQLEWLQGTLRGGSWALSSGSSIQAIVSKGGVAEKYLRDTLKMNGTAIRSFSPGTLGGELADRSRSVRGVPPVPFLLADEYSCLLACESLIEKDLRPCLLFPLMTQESAKRDKKRLLPIYLMGITSASDSQDLVGKYLDRGLRLLLLSEVELCSDYLADLYGDLHRKVRGILEKMRDKSPVGYDYLVKEQEEPCADPQMWPLACAIQYARYALRLNRREELSAVEDLNLPWRHILHNVRERQGVIPEGAEPISEGRFKLGYRVFPPFCKKPTDRPPDPIRPTVDLSEFGFLGRMLRHFQHLADPTNVQELKEPTQWTDRADVEDIRIGLFETYNRSRRWRFFRSNCFLPLNAILYTGNLNEEEVKVYKNNIRQSLLGKTSNTAFEAVVLKGGSAHEYLELEAELKHDQLIYVSHLDERDYVREITKTDKGKPRVAVVDLLHCLGTMGHLNGKATLIFPFPLMEKDTPVQENLPEYNVGIAVNRGQPQWIEYAQYAAGMLLTEKKQYLLAEIEQLRLELSKTIGEQLKKIAGFDCGLEFGVGMDEGSLDDTVDKLVRHMLCLTDEERWKRPGRWWYAILQEAYRTEQRNKT